HGCEAPAMKRFRAGIVGCGFVSQYHAAALQRIPNAELVGVVDLDQQRASRAATRYRVRQFDSLDSMRQAGVDVVHVLTPPESHREVTLAALELGCHVLVEKPLAVDLNDCRRIEEAAARQGRQVSVNHSLLYDPQVRRALQTVRAGRLGRVVSVDIFRSSAYPPYRGGP